MLIGAPAVAPRCWGQGTPDQLNSLGANFEGFQFYGVSAFLNHSEYGFPQQNTTAGATSLDSRTNFGVSGTIGWQRFHGKLNFSALYTGSYFGDTHNSDLNNAGHSASLSVSRAFGPKWNVDFAGVGQVMSIEQLISNLTSLGALAQSQASIADLGMQLQTASTGTSPTSAILLGNHLMTYNAKVSLSYHPTSRLSISLGSFAAGGQHLTGNSALATNYVMPHSLGGDAGVSVRYSLTPRTDFGLGISQTYVQSSLQQGYGTNLSGSLSRKMTTHWFASISAGGSRFGVIHQTSGSPPTLQITYGASTGYRLRTITFVATYSQSGSDQSSGLIGRNRNVQAAASWHPLRRAWSVDASYSRNETTSTGFSTLSGWRVGGNFSRNLPWNLVLATSYTYLSSRGVYLGFPNELTLNGVRVSFGWTPVRRHVNSTQQADPIE
jgi:hypothetical protein